METKYIRLDFEEALSAKKQFLSAEMNLLHTAKGVRNYKLFRKKESMIKKKLRASLRSLNVKIQELQSTFPEETIPEAPKKKNKKMKEKQELNLQEQLQEIQDKLEKLQEIQI